MTSSEDSMNQEAIVLLMSVLGKHFGIFIDPDDYEKTIYSCERAEKYKNVYFIKLSSESDLSKLCMLARNSDRRHRGQSTRSYCVNIKTNKVMSNCFSSKCKKRGGKFVFQEVATSSEEDDSEEETLTTSKKRKI